ncbi:MAG: cellulose biosynthesis cyclic di-GMP-binding regulatory protein BcsB [Roseiflexus sp.]|uniref:cellulose biosynthesis cyclic di-GMP-binding regulatory protein BcsB n=1 Tax=Roseiflexus sp. TaxID=2562120 RepID=UPI0025F2F6CF|nr:cellulose biosynthesis cyclic di-GMP-binding regulatory protein BcsB [Roseiflexus sp.]MCL6541482.1 cellulose biosynthesis cyclic di-GMP-binding regulatory protein BcsB [Roseiflexus sp.]
MRISCYHHRICTRLSLAWALLFLGALVVGATPPSATAAARPQSESGTHRFAELGYGDRTARTMHGGLDYFFPVPAGEEPVEGARLELIYSHSPLLLPERSTMTIIVNGLSVQSVRLTPDTRTRASLTVPLPPDLFGGEGFFVQVRFQMRLTHDECEETRNPALWATIHGDSRLVLPTQPVGTYRLEHLDRLFRPPSDNRPPLTLIIPPAPSPEELESAGLITFQLGRWASAVHADPRLDISTTLPEGAGIVVGSAPALTGMLPWDVVGWNGDAVTLRGVAIPPDDGVLALANGGAPRLLVTGATPAAVRLAAQTLVTPERRALLDGAYVAITDAPVPETATAPWTNGAASFAQLGVSSRSISGPGEHRIDLAFTRPAGWRLRDGSTLTLDVEVTPAVRRETSWIAASVNGIDLGAQPLRFDTALPHRYSFALPADLLTTTLDGRSVRNLDLTVRLFLDPPDEGCVIVDGDSLRATLLPTSAWRLPHDVSSTIDLGRFPAPLLSVDTRLPLTVVLPQQPDAREYAVALRLMAALGRWADTDSIPPPQLTTADRLEERDGRHLILIGGSERNVLSAEVIARQPDRFATPQAAVYRPDETGQCRLILGLSPWQRDAALLLIDGATPEDLSTCVAALERRETIERLRGPLVLIRTNAPPQNSAGASDVASPPPSLTPQIETPLLERLPGWQIAGAVLLGAFLSALVILLTIQVRGRTRRRG